MLEVHANAGVRSVGGSLRVLVHVAGLLLLLAMFCGTRVAAQANSGITGVVTDASGGVIGDVTVTLANPTTSYSATAKSNSSGTYIFRVVPPGDYYTLTFTKPGFRTFSFGGVSLGVGITETKDVQLQVGDTKQTVIVESHGEATLNTTDASIGNVIDTKRIEELPSLIRTNAAAILELQPGVQVSGMGDQFGSVTGSRADAANITVDGMDANDETIGQAFVTASRIPLDAVDEVRTIVGGPDSSFGRSTGAQVDLATKSGTNEFHGSAHEYNRITAYAANDWFNNFAGVKRPALIRNQFGGDLGGPIIKKKLFFFFDYEARHDNIADQETRIVPMDNVRAGEINYVNNGAGCDSSSTVASAPACISTLPATAISGQSVQSLDPAGIGANANLLTYLNTRYPEPNDFAIGDGVNTAGFRFNAPQLIREASYIGRLDYNLSSKQSIFARATWDRDTNDDGAPQFPVDGSASLLELNHSRSYVIGDTWSVSNTIVNKAAFGVTRSVLAFNPTNTSSAPNSFSFGPYSDPLAGLSSQGRNVPVPEIRDDLTWAKGRHTLQFGVDGKFIRVHSSLNNSIDFTGLGLGGNLQSLGGPANVLRPSDMYQNSSDPGSMSEYDSVFPFVLGRFTGTTVNYNYNTSGTAFPLYTPSVREFAYNEMEIYGQDTWRINTNLALNFGLRWQYHAVPYEVNGFQSVSTVDETQLFSARVTNAFEGVNGNGAAPLVSYVLGGPKNHGPGYYRPDYRDFAPKLGLAYSPSFTEGMLGKIFGDRKSSIRAGAGLNFDRVLSTLSFEIDQSNFIFSNQQNQPFGSNADPGGSLASDPRFANINTPPPSPAAPTITTPYTPNVDSSGNPIGLAVLGGFPNLFQLDTNLKTPYVISFSLGWQRELPGGFLFEADYYGKLGRRLLADGDAAQTLNFKDATSGQFLKAAFAGVQQQVQGGTSPGAVSAQPWFENQISQGVAQFGLTCPTTAPFFGLSANNCTQLAAQLASPYFPVGDVSSTILVLSETGILPSNDGLLAQTGSAGYVGNYGSSNYNALVLTLRKKLSNNLQFDFDYAYSHSIDNVSEITNNANQYTGTGQFLVCDLTNLRTCRASSDFDARHTVSINYDYHLPVGTGQRYLGSSSKLLNALVGGWGTSGIVSAHTGYPFNLHTGTFPINFTQDAAPVFVGPASNIAQSIHVENGTVQFFKSQSNALNAFAFPFGGDTGNRNAVTGPGFWNVDMAILKNFSMPWSDHQTLQFRAEAFNVFNHPSFDPPGNDFSSGASILSPGNFGTILSTASTARQLQLALRYDF